MKNKPSSRIVQFLPLIGILVIFCMQHYYAYQNLQSNERLANEQFDNLRADMQADNIPSNIKEPILAVARNSTFQIWQAVSSQIPMTIFFQFNILIMVYFFYVIQNSKTKQAVDQDEL